MSDSGVKHVVGFSGGIDSQATALWVREHFPAEDIILLNSDVGGHEHPITSEFIRSYSEHVFPVIVTSPLIRDLGGVGSRSGQIGNRRHEYDENDVLTMEALAYIKGRFPSRTRQFCTQFLKLAPQRRWSEENIDTSGLDIIRYVGVRRDESQDRRKTPDSMWDSYFDCDIKFPLADWSKQQCFDYVQDHGEAVNPLYTMGFGRIGCAPCINSGKQDIREWATRFPEMIDKVRGWERNTGWTFFAPCVPGKEINWVDEVMEWSKTTRGGSVTQLRMLDDEPVLVCSSKYGLCE